MTKLNKHMVLGVTFLCLSALVAGASASEEMAEGMPEVLRFSSYMGEPGAEVHIAEWPSQMAIVAAAENYMGMPIEIEWVLLPPGDHRDRQLGPAVDRLLAVVGDATAGVGDRVGRRLGAGPDLLLPQ